MSSARINYTKVAPEPYRMLLEVRKWLDASGLDLRLRALLEVRISQINGCGLCVDIHSQEARQHGVPQQHLDCLPAWRECPLVYSDLERAALEWAESITLLADRGADDEDFGEIRGHLTDEQLVALTWAIVAMNSWNRLALAFGFNPRPRRAE